MNEIKQKIMKLFPKFSPILAETLPFEKKLTEKSSEKEIFSAISEYFFEKEMNFFETSSEYEAKLEEISLDFYREAFVDEKFEQEGYDEIFEKAEEEDPDYCECGQRDDERDEALEKFEQENGRPFNEDEDDEDDLNIDYDYCEDCAYHTFSEEVKDDFLIEAEDMDLEELQEDRIFTSNPDLVASINENIKEKIFSFFKKRFKEEIKDQLKELGFIGKIIFDEQSKTWTFGTDKKEII